MDRWRAADSRRAGLLPDAVTDTTQRRRIAGARRLDVLRRVRREAVRRGSDGVLVAVSWHLPGLQLYGQDDHSEARRRVLDVLDGWPAWFTLESGEVAGLHVHLITVTEAVPGVLARAGDLPALHGTPVWDLRGLLDYLSKPRLGAACTRGHRRAVPLAGLLDAAETYLSARATAAAAGRSRLPAGSGVLNVPPRRRVPAAPRPVLSLLILAHRLAGQVAALLRIATRGHVRPSPGHSGRAVCRRPVPGRPVSVRRPLLIGHARPPPRERPRGWSSTPSVRGLPGTTRVRCVSASLSLPSTPPA